MIACFGYLKQNERTSLWTRYTQVSHVSMSLGLLIEKYYHACDLNRKRSPRAHARASLSLSHHSDARTPTNTGSAHNGEVSRIRIFTMILNSRMFPFEAEFTECSATSDRRDGSVY
jgi:hypothetical protein